MSMESIGGTINEDFEEFLRYRWCEGIGGCKLEKWSKEKQKFVGALDLEQELVDAGLEGKAAADLNGIIWVGIGEIEEQTYIKGVKDGFNLALHLLGDKAIKGGYRKCVRPN
jgi:hypothetical protein